MIETPDGVQDKPEGSSYKKPCKINKKISGCDKKGI
jgi:hypothetical protein